MKLFKCYFKLDNGIVIKDLEASVFSEDKELVKRYLEFKLCESNDDYIYDLKIIEIEIFDGLIL